MSKSKIIKSIVIVVIIILGGYILFGRESEEQISGEPIKIGVVLPITGSLNSYGEFEVRGLEMALEEVNAKGINGRLIELIVEDSQGKVSIGLSAVRKLINQDKVKVIIGDVASSVTLGFAPVAEENEVIVLAPGSAVPALRESGDFIFRIKLNSDLDSIELAEYAFNKFDFKKVAVVYINNDYGVGIKNKFIEKYEELGGEIVRIESFLPEATDMRSSLTKLKNDDIDGILLASYAPEAGIFLKQLGELEIDKPILTHRAGIGPETITIAGEKVNGVLFLEEFDVTNESFETKNFVNKYETMYNETPSLFSVMSYDALRIIASALIDCGENPRCIRDYLYNLKDYPGASGIVNFDEKGDVIKNLKLMTVKNGQFVPYEE